MIFLCTWFLAQRQGLWVVNAWVGQNLYGRVMDGIFKVWVGTFMKLFWFESLWCSSGRLLNFLVWIFMVKLGTHIKLFWFNFGGGVKLGFFSYRLYWEGEIEQGFQYAHLYLTNSAYIFHHNLPKFWSCLFMLVHC